MPFDDPKFIMTTPEKKEEEKDPRTMKKFSEIDMLVFAQMCGVSEDKSYRMFRKIHGRKT